MLFTPTLSKSFKPAPDPILFALKYMGITDPHSVLMVGDAAPDIQSGNRSVHHSFGLFPHSHYHLLSPLLLLTHYFLSHHIPPFFLLFFSFSAGVYTALVPHTRYTPPFDPPPTFLLHSMADLLTLTPPHT